MNTNMTKADKIKQILKENGSKICSVDFVKADGTLRKMQVQLRSTKGVKGEDASEQAQRATKARKENNPDLINVYDVQLKKKGLPDAACRRSFHADTVFLVSAGGEKYSFELSV